MAPVKRHAYLAQFKLQAIEYAAQYGNLVAVRHFDLNESSYVITWGWIMDHGLR